MATLRTDKGRLFVDLMFRGERCREALHLAATRENRRKAELLVRKIDAELALGRFDYAATFPRSKRLARFELTRTETPTLGEYAQRWLELRKPELKPATAYDYKKLLTAHILPSLIASKRMDHIRPGDIRAFVAELDAKRTATGKKKLGPRRINMARDRLFTMFKEARADGLVTDNPVLHVKRLSEPVPEIDPFTFEEVQNILREARGQERALFAVLLLTGLRPGEAIALRWDDIDLDRNQIRVRKTLNRYGVDAPKTRGSIRDVEMFPSVRAALLALPTRFKNDLLFQNEDGGPLDETNVRERTWRRLLRRASLRYRPLYHCRHTYATLELANRENVLVVARQMGHNTAETTLRRYARYMKGIPRTGMLAQELSKAELRQKRGQAKAVGATRKASNSADFAERNHGAGDRGRTGDVQLGKLAFYH